MRVPLSMQKTVQEGKQKQSVAHQAEPCWLTNPLHRIAARLRFGMNPKSLGLGGKR